ARLKRPSTGKATPCNEPRCIRAQPHHGCGDFVVCGEPACWLRSIPSTRRELSLDREIQLVVSKEAIQSAVAAYFGASRAMDANAVAEAFAPDGVSNDPVGTPPHVGRDAIRQFMHGVIAESQRVESTADDVFIAGDSAAVKWTVQLTAKNGQSVTF